jgi:hypothetical protein
MPSPFRLGLVLLIAALSRATAQESSWEPQRTWVFAVGALKFDRKTTFSFPNKDRADVKLLDVWKKRGVPESQIVFIKNEEATKAGIEARLAPFAQQPRAADTLIFYYTGHGGRDMGSPSRAVSFATYDTRSTWTVNSIVETIERHFRGKQVLYFADCCHSGALADRISRGRQRAAALCSANVTSTSTGNWTFTETLVRVFDGDGISDANRDGSITFTEGAAFVHREMVAFEDQLAARGLAGGFPPGLQISPTTTSPPPGGRIGEVIEVKTKDKWWTGRIIEEKGNRVKVTHPGWGADWDEWAGPNRVRPVQKEAIPKGTRVRVEWNGQWYDARIVEVVEGVHRVHYEGYPNSDDEFVSRGRIQMR